MTLVNARAAFEKAVTDAVAAVDASVTMLYDNIPYTLPSKTTKYIGITVIFNQSTVQAQGGAADFYSGRIQCNIYIPRNSGTATLSALGEAVIDGLTSVNASGYTDTFNCKPRSLEISGPIPVDLDDESHFLGIVSCVFSANA